MGNHAETHCVPRPQKVVEGELGGISEAVAWKGGGGFRYYRLGAPIFDADGLIHPDVRFSHLAAHVWFCETGRSLDRRVRSALLGVNEGIGYYLLVNGILGDRSPDGGNVLTRRVLGELPRHDGPRVIYGTSCRLGAATLRSERITFKQIPYDIKVR
jgi:adenine-specific DNA-methyltransferase